MRDDLEKAIAATKARETPETWGGFIRQNKWACIAVLAMFVLVILEISAVWG